MAYQIRHDSKFAWTVTELNECARGILLDCLAAPLWLQGELGRITCQPSGHVYSKLKDELGATVDIVYFHGARKMRELCLQPGAIVMCYGRVDLFTRDGRFQFIVSDLRAFDQRGALMQRYLETRAKLEAEGLFRPERKRPLPIFPKCIGLLTSASGAAIHDFLETALARIPNLHIRILPVPVQGAGAGAKIARALQYLAAHGGCDVIVITRGGGSMEDLWEFNDETLARTIAASPVPVVSAVGHQIDSTMCDFVADRSVITPTEAAVAVTEAALRVSQYLLQLRQRLLGRVQLMLSVLRNRLLKAAACPLLQRPEELYGRQAQRLDQATARLQQFLPQRALDLRHRLEDCRRRLPPAMTQLLSRARSQQQRNEALLAAFNPRAVLQRGYALLLDQDGKAIRKAQETHERQSLRALLAEGEIAVTVAKSP